MRWRQVSSLLVIAGSTLAGGCKDELGVTPFVWTVSPHSVEIAVGGLGHVQVQVQSKNNINHDVALTTGTIPAGLVVTIPARMTSTQETADVTISASLGIEEGTYTFKIFAEELGGDPTAPHEEEVSAIVTAGGVVPDFLLEVTPNPHTPAVDGHSRFDYTVTQLRGFTGMVNIALTGLPDDLTLVEALTPPTITFSLMVQEPVSGHFALTFHPIPPVPSVVDLELTASSVSPPRLHTQTIRLNLLAP